MLLDVLHREFPILLGLFDAIQQAPALLIRQITKELDDASAVAMHVALKRVGAV
jgi:hypothetical protein